MRRRLDLRIDRLSRRGFLRLASAGAVGAGSMSGWLGALAAAAGEQPGRVRSCILLWMAGGPSQLDTFDLKPGHENGGSFQPIATTVPGLAISEHLPKMAEMMSETALIRSMKTREGDHSRATYLMRTGYLPQGPVRFPTLGSMLSKELATPDGELPAFISIAPLTLISPAAFGPGFLGPLHSPMVVGGAGLNLFGQGQPDPAESLRVRNLQLPDGVSPAKAEARLGLLDAMERDFLARRPGEAAAGHRAAYRRAVKMMNSSAVSAFDLKQEPDALRNEYGRNQFGQGCLLARRLVQRGVPFVEVSLNGAPGSQVFGWDTHLNNFTLTRQLSGILDPAWATLIRDLKNRGMLESTLVVWMGEFGRTPKINANQGRDHFPAAWTTVLAGGGVKGGALVGATSDDGMEVRDRPVKTADLLATVCRSLGVDYEKQNMSNVGRPIRLVDPEAAPIEEIVS